MAAKTSASPGYRALRKGRMSLPQQVYHLTISTHERRAVFGDWQHSRPVAHALNDPSLIRDARTLAWVLMPDHLHWLLQLGERAELSRVVQAVKSRSAIAINRLDHRSGPVWAVGYHDHALRRDEDLRVVARYLAANPLKAGLVQSLADYPCWDAIWLDDLH